MLDPAEHSSEQDFHFPISPEQSSEGYQIENDPPPKKR